MMTNKLYLLLFILFTSQLFGKDTDLPDVITQLQTDRHCYISGDFILLKLVSQQLDTNTTLQESVMYVDIVNTDSLFITGEAFKFNQGTASGFLRIPDTLKTGYYTIRAYTYESRNRSNQNILSFKEIFVTNRFNRTIKNYEGDYSLSNSPLLERSDGEFLLMLSDTVFNQRSKIAGKIQLAQENSNEIAWLALTVRPVSICESRFDGIKEQLTNKRKQDKSNQQNYVATEKKPNMVTGQVTDSLSGKPMPGILVLATAEDSILSIKHCITNINGEFEFLLGNEPGSQKLYLSACSYPDLKYCPLAKITLTENGDMPDILIQQSRLISENKGMLVSGNVSDNITGESISNALVIMAVEDSVLRIKYSITNEKGQFKILLSDSYKVQKVYLSAYSYPNPNFYSQAKITIDSKFLDEVKPIVEPKRIVGGEKSIDSLNVLKSIIAIAYEISLMDDIAYRMPDELLFEHQFLPGNVTYSVNIDDYIDLPDFIEITKEILPFIRLEKRDNTYAFYLNNGDLTRKYPFVFVDGVPLNNANAILDWGSDKIEMVQLQRESRYFGDVPFEDGILFIWTKNMDFWAENGSRENQCFTLPHIQKPVVLKFPDYTKENNNRHPDFRQVLFWEPSITINNNKPFEFNFYSSDEVGEFEVLLQGMTNNYQSVEIRKYFRVKND